MNDPLITPRHESLLLRVLWMLVFLLVWWVAEAVLGALIVLQLIYRLFYGAPNGSLMNFGDGLSQFLAQIGRFGCFHTDQKPWPFSDWPQPRAAQGEPAHKAGPASPSVPDEERKL